MNWNQKSKISVALLVLILTSLACRQTNNSGKSNSPSEATAEPTGTAVVSVPDSTREPTQPAVPTQQLAPSSTPFPTETQVPSLTPGTVMDAATQDLIDQLNGLLTDLEKDNAAGDNLDNLP